MMMWPQDTKRSQQTTDIELFGTSNTSTHVVYRSGPNVIAIYDSGSKPSILKDVLKALSDSIPKDQRPPALKPVNTMYLPTEQYAAYHKTISRSSTIDFEDTFYRMGISRTLMQDVYEPHLIVLKQNLPTALSHLNASFPSLANRENMESATKLIQSKGMEAPTSGGK